MSVIAHVGGVSVDTRHWIGGRRVESAATFDDISPIDGSVIATIARGGERRRAGLLVGRHGESPFVRSSSSPNRSSRSSSIRR